MLLCAGLPLLHMLRLAHETVLLPSCGLTADTCNAMSLLMGAVVKYECVVVAVVVVAAVWQHMRRRREACQDGYAS